MNDAELLRHLERMIRQHRAELDAMQTVLEQVQRRQLQLTSVIDQNDAHIANILAKLNDATGERHPYLPEGWDE